MTANRFEQVDEPADDALTLALAREGEARFGIVSCPAAASGGRLPKDFASDAMPLKEAFRTAVSLANELRMPLVVLDPHDLWQAEWGTLERMADGAAG